MNACDINKAFSEDLEVNDNIYVCFSYVDRLKVLHIL